MKTILLHAAVMAAILSITGCGPVAIDADIPDRGGLLTVTGLFAADSTWNIDVDSSKRIIDTKVAPGTNGVRTIGAITNAQVTILENGQFSDNLVYSRRFSFLDLWWYRSSKPEIHPVAGKTYDIAVTVPGIGTATSTCSVPLPARMISLKADTVTTVIRTEIVNGGYKDAGSFETVPIEVVIDDPAGENYYEMFVKFQRRDGPPFYTPPAPVFTKDLQFHNTGIPLDSRVISGQDTPYYSVIFRDVDVKAKHLKLTVMMPVELSLSHTVVLRTLSKEYFQYIASQELQTYSYDDPFAQPVVVYGNIQGGLGIFAGFSENAMDVEF